MKSLIDRRNELVDLMNRYLKFLPHVSFSEKQRDSVNNLAYTPRINEEKRFLEKERAKLITETVKIVYQIRQIDKLIQSVEAELNPEILIIEKE